jgi:carbon storage regulator
MLVRIEPLSISDRSETESDGLIPASNELPVRASYIFEREVMLVLSRKTSERILIGDEIAITILRIGPNSVRVGIDAPKTMSIVRGELAKELVDALKHDCD